MARRNYAARGGKQKQKSRKVLLISIAVLLVIAFAVGLYFMMKKTPTPVVIPPQKVENVQPKSVLPSRPEEVWSYIQALETRTIPVDEKSIAQDKSLSLTEEQRKILQIMAAEQKQAEQQMALKSTALSAQKNTTDTANQVKVVEREQKPATISTAKVESSSQKKYGLQCGAFKNKTQADNLQVRLAALGLNAKVNSNDDWHRVVVGSVGDRASTQKAKEKAKSVINCVLIGM